MKNIYNIIVILFVLYIGFQLMAFLIVMLNCKRMRKKYLKQKLKCTNVVENHHGSFGLKQESFIKKQYRKLDPIVSGLTKYVSIQISKIPSHNIRHFLIKKILSSGLSYNTVVYHGAIFRGSFKIDIGCGTVIGDECLLDGRGGLVIGENCNLSTGVKIWTAQHDMNSPDFAYEEALVTIGDRCWVSGGVTILPGITVGEGCVIASGAVVTKDCEPYGIYAGIPAKKIGIRNQELSYVFDGSHDWYL